MTKAIYIAKLLPVVKTLHVQNGQKMSFRWQ